MILIFRLVWQSGIAPPESSDPEEFPFTCTAAEYDERLAALHLAVTSLRRFDATQCTNKTDGPYCNFFDKDGIVVTMIRKSPVQFGPIYWDIFFRIRKTMGDFDDLIATHIKQPSDLDTFHKRCYIIPLKWYPDGTFDEKGRSVLHGNIISFVDQLLCVAVYGSLSELYKRVPVEKRERLFDDAPSRAYAAREAFVAGWKLHFTDPAAMPKAERRRSRPAAAKARDREFDVTSSEAEEEQGNGGEAAHDEETAGSDQSGLNAKVRRDSTRFSHAT